MPTPSHPDEAQDIFEQEQAKAKAEERRAAQPHQEPRSRAEAQLASLGDVRWGGTADEFASVEETGIYRGVPEEAYHAHPALSRSVLAEAARYSPIHAHHRWRSEEEESTSDAASLGTALHARVLQPSVYEDTYDVAAEQCEGIKGDGDRCSYSAKHRHDGTWYCGTHAPDGEPDDIEVLKASVHEDVEAMTQALRGNPDASQLLFGLPGYSEVTILWKDDATGLLCKARPDRIVGLPDGGVTIVDLKSTRSAHPEDFRRKVAQYGYWLQPPFYTLAIQGGTEGDIPVRDFVFACVESSPPYAVQCYRPHPEEERAVQARTCELLDQIAECVEKDTWSSYQKGVAQVSVKRYEKERLGIQPT